jgi:hypothetical protein
VRRPRSASPALRRALAQRGVGFIAAGGAGAVLNGAPVTTLDPDIVRCPNPGGILSGTIDHLAGCRDLPSRAADMKGAGVRLRVLNLLTRIRMNEGTERPGGLIP